MGADKADENVPVDFFDDDRPRYHIQPPAGWMNDPNGPVYYRGRYHMFYQYLPAACEWDFGIVWGHAVSSDLIRWEHLPPALVPTPGWVDADGCFSGCCVVDQTTGRPVILYTGVRLRSNVAAGQLPPPEQDLGMVWIESQCIAEPEDPNDDLLINWKKTERPFLPLPPAELELTGWRDPFVMVYNNSSNLQAFGSGASADAQLDCNGHGSNSDGNDNTTTHSETSNSSASTQYKMLIGSGIKGRGGTALVYRSSRLTDGWELEGELCTGKSTDTGVVWECPLLVPLLPVPQELTTPHPSLPPPWLISRRIMNGGHQQQSGELTQEVNGGGAGGALWGEKSPFDIGATAAALTAAGVPSGGQGTEPASLDFQFTASGFDLEKQPSAQLWPGAELNVGGSRRGGGGAAGSGGGGMTAAQALAAASAAVQQHRASSSGPLTPGDLIELAAQMERATTLENWAQMRNGSIASIGSGRNGSGSDGDARSSSRAGTTRDGDVTIASVIEEEVDIDIDGGGDDQGGINKSSSSLSSCSAERSANGAAVPTTATDQGTASAPSSRQSEEEDRFAAAQLRVRSVATARTAATRNIPTTTSSLLPPPPQLLQPARSSTFAGAYATNHASNAPSTTNAPAISRQWHLFTVSPDAPTNPVLYWTGHVAEESSPTKEESSSSSTRTTTTAPASAVKFELESAKGPYRLDLGDILYAPNVCQDGQGRWLLWGWLQERRKVGTYNYAGCLSIPRVLHCTDDGRLIQAPAPEVAELRQSRSFVARGVTLYPDAVVPVQNVRGDRLDIECTIDRGSAIAAGILFRSHEAEAEGSTAVVYDWDRNQLEAIFNVPPTWQPVATSGAGGGVGGGDMMSDIFDGIDGVFDPAAALCTPRHCISRSTSFAGFVGGTGTTALVSAPASDRSSRRSSLESPHHHHEGGGDTPTALGTSSPAISGITDENSIGTGIQIPGNTLRDSPSLLRTGSSLSLCLQRTNSYGGAGAGGLLGRTASTLGTSYYGPPSRSGSIMNTPKLGSLAGLAALGGSASGLVVGSGGGFGDVGGCGQGLDGGGGEEDLAHLLEDLAAPMRAPEEHPSPMAEPRRVGGGLRMSATDKLHLRIIVDHSCIEVFAGTGEVLSTRIYRGRGPRDGVEAGIDFVAFGGAALLERVEAYEVGSAWASAMAETPRAVPQTTEDGAAATYLQQQKGTPKSRGSTPRTSLQGQGGPLSPLGAMNRNVSLADELFDEILMGMERESSAAGQQQQQPITAQ